MMPTKPMGPPTETARAGGEHDPPKNAIRCARSMSTTAVPAASAPSASRLSGRARNANAAKAIATSGSADRMGRS